MSMRDFVACTSADTGKSIAVLAVQTPIKAIIVVHADTAPATVYRPLLMSSVIVLGEDNFGLMFFLNCLADFITCRSF
jgi:threonine dehydratase